MTEIRRIELAPAAGPGVNVGQRDSEAPDQAFVGRTSAAAPGRALVPSRPSPRPTDAFIPVLRPCATFLAHLIATALRAPQTRARRRAEPADATAVYAKGAAADAGEGHSVSRSV